MVESKAEKDRKNRVRKWGVVGRIYGMKYSLINAHHRFT